MNFLCQQYYQQKKLKLGMVDVMDKGWQMKGFLFVLILLVQGTMALAANCPKSTTGQILFQKYFSISYNKDHKIAEWGCYTLTRSMLRGEYPRQQIFVTDKRLIPIGPTTDQYNFSGFDRGHIVPAEDMSFDAKAIYLTFLMSNVAPQVPSFNRGLWRSLETYTRRLADQYGEILVVTGPVIEKGLKKLGSTGISIPNFFYRIIYYRTAQGERYEAFMMPNKDGQQGQSIDSYRENEIRSFLMEPYVDAPIDYKATLATISRATGIRF